MRAPIEENNCGVRNARVTTVTIGDVFHKQRALAFGNPLFRKLDALVDSDDIHGINLTEFVSSCTGKTWEIAHTWIPGMVSPRV